MAWLNFSDAVVKYNLKHLEDNKEINLISIYVLVEIPCTRVGKANSNTNQLRGGTHSAEYQKKVTRGIGLSVDLEV